MMVLVSDDIEMKKDDTRNTHFGIIIKSLKPKRTFFSDRNYYSIVLQLGKGKFSYADKCVLVNQPSILYSTPLLPYAWESISQDDAHDELYYKIFFEKTIIEEMGENLIDTPFNNKNKEPIVFLNFENALFLKSIFEKVNEGCQSQSIPNIKFFSSYLYIILHELNGLRNIPVYSYKSAAQRIVELFLNMLDSQFSHFNNTSCIELIKPVQYAEKLCIHVNHLNRVVKKITGKTTTEIITGRMIEKAKELLNTTDLSIYEIADRLGFGEVASFSKFFRIHTGICPKVYRAMSYKI